MTDAEEMNLILTTLQFETAFCEPARFGAVEGGDGRTVWITLLMDTASLDPRRKTLFDRDDDKPAILVGYENADNLPRDCEVPDESKLVTFPASFNGMPVDYLRVPVAELEKMHEYQRAKTRPRGRGLLKAV